MIEYHADDYGLFLQQSRRIIDCYYNGVLNGISIFPNSPYLKESMDCIEEIKNDLFITAHLNFIEGKPLTGKKAYKLVGADGNFNIGFIKLLLISYMPIIRLRYREQIKREIEAQLLACEQYMNNGVYRIDGHVHFHMIPIIFDALMSIIKERHLKVSYIRFPKEEIGIYIKSVGKRDNIKFINIIKVIILNYLVKRNRKKYREELKELGIENKLFMGVMMSGHMFYDNVKACLAYTGDFLTEKDDGMEILFHPGGVFEKDDSDKITSKDDYIFMTNKNRYMEAEGLKKWVCKS